MGVKTDLLEKILHPVNLTKAMERVESNKGAAGVDKMNVSELRDYWHQNKEGIMEAIRSGRYQPNFVKGIEIDKLSGGKRLLGIPTVIDRLIQQAIHQVLSPMYELEF